MSIDRKPDVGHPSDAGGSRRVTTTLGGLAVEICVSDDPAGEALLAYLGEFYRLRDGSGETVAWTVDARLGKPGMEMATNPFGVGYHVDADRRRVVLRAQTPYDLQVTARKCVREVFLGYCEGRRYAMLHASAVAGPPTPSGRRRVVLFVGEKGAGKTTLALRLVLDGGWQLLSNDHLILFSEPSPRPGALGDVGDAGVVLIVTSLPTLIPVTIGTFVELLDRYRDRLPSPWDTQGIDPVEYRGLTAEQRHTLGAKVLYTYRRLGQGNPLLTPLDERTAVAVVLPTYAAPAEPLCPPVPVVDPAAALRPHLRSDWPLDPRLNQRHLTRVQRDAGRLAADGARLVAALAARAPVLSWHHRGDPGGLIDCLDRSWAERAAGHYAGSSSAGSDPGVALR